MPNIPNEKLRSAMLPVAGADWGTLGQFALTYPGYDRAGSFDLCAEVANRAAQVYSRLGSLPTSLDELRGCLFFEQRRWRHFGEDPDEPTMNYLHSLVEAIRRQVLLKSRSQDGINERFSRKQALQSIVRVHRTKRATGLGVFTDQGVILTAAHCLPESDADDPYRSSTPVTVTAVKSGASATALVQCMDPCMDVAVLADTTLRGGGLTGPARAEYLNAVKTLTGSAISLDAIQFDKATRVYIYTHTKKWVSGKISCHSAESPHLNLSIDMRYPPIGSGTSGSPVFDSRGLVIGLVCESPDREEDRSAGVVRLSMAMPGWLLANILSNPHS